MSQIVHKYNLGIIIDVFNDNIESKIINYINEFNPDEFNENCENF